MEKWVITPAPTAHDPRRYLLLVQGLVGELSPLLKRFGAACGRPAPLKSPEGYNLRLYLHGLSPGGLEGIRALLGELAPAPSPQSPPERAPLAPLEAAPAPESKQPASQGRQGRPLGEPLLGLRERPDPLRHLDSLLVGAHNRFAHAAASSVISAPGAMYNPLFLHGPPGTGKTHTLQAIAVGLSRSLGEGRVVLTSGPRLACAVSAALSEGGLGEIKASLGKAKALLVDDIHLLAVTEHNRSALARVFGLFQDRSLQVAFASLYPPKALGALEDSLSLSFERGAVDLKPPSPAAQLEIIRAFCDRNGVALNAREIMAFHERLGPNAFEAARWLRRLAAMSGLPELASRAPSAEEMIPLLFAEAPIPREGGAASGELEPGSLDFPTAAQLAGLKGFPSPAPGPRALGLAVLAPQGEEERLSPWMVARFHQAGARYGLSSAYRLVLVASYDPGQPFGVPFEIGERCLKAGAQAALIMGPPDHSSLAGQAAEFSHAVGHILESLGIAMAAIPWRGTTSDGNFLRAHLDLAAPRYG